MLRITDRTTGTGRKASTVIQRTEAHLPPLRLAIYRGKRLKRFIEVDDPRNGIARHFNELNQGTGNTARVPAEAECTEDEPAPAGLYRIVIDGKEEFRARFDLCVIWLTEFFREDAVPATIEAVETSS